MNERDRGPTGQSAPRAEDDPAAAVDETPPSWHAAFTLPGHAGAPRAARRLVSTLLIAWDVADQVEPAELIASELVNFAVGMQPTRELELQITMDQDDLCIVLVGSPTEPGRQAVTPWGHPALFLVDRLADDWGLDQSGRHARLWARIDITEGRSGDGWSGEG
ncbi:MAG: hypothetical protein IPG94_23345 [Kineosporiaceae bacterium]|nr:hypothetical protein [Kineosporiaceae bacterium]